MAKKSKDSKFGLGVLVGAGLGAIGGAVAGILTAPKSGKETRADIARESKKVAKKAQVAGKKTVAKFTGKKTANKK